MQITNIIMKEEDLRRDNSDEEGIPGWIHCGQNKKETFRTIKADTIDNLRIYVL